MNERTINNGLVYFNDKIILPLKLKQLILSLLYETYMSVMKTFNKAKCFYYLPFMGKGIE